MHVGNISIEPVIDGVVRLPPTDAYRGMGAAAGARGTDDADWAPHRGLLAEDGMLEMALGGFLVRTGDRVALVDTGVGELDRGIFRGGAFLDSLAAFGVGPDDVTDVLLTHLHFDHVGWTSRHGEVVFRNATYRCDPADWKHFVGPDPGATKKLQPIEDRLEPWGGNGPVLPGVDAMSAPGHTPGSTIMVVSSGTDRAMLLGDVVHCPVELVDNEWAGIGDVDPDLALRTRLALMKELEGTDTPVAAAHFPGLQFGRVLFGTGTRSWVLE
jgi:glyoxylase-like metal-dependent hydrolase (beta-lactamase superfamily II)